MIRAIRSALKAILPSAFRRRLKAAYHVGSRHTCPLCNSRLRRFLPLGLPFAVLTDKEVVGGSPGEYVLCPVCDSVDRDRLLYLYLKNKTDLFQRRQKILHVAPEKNFDKLLRHYGDDYLTADLYEPDVKVRMDIMDIQFPDASFDVILCNHVLEHVADDHHAMRELFRVLKPGGWAILQVPMSLVLQHTYEDPAIITPAAREQAFGQSDHVRLYALDYVDRLRQAGFKVDIYRWTTEHDLYGGDHNRFGLNQKEAIYHAIKQI